MLWFSKQSTAPRWMHWMLAFAGAYNLLFGAWAVLLPQQAFALAHLPQPNYVELWQCVGMIVGCYGVGYACAARDPYRHWPVVLVGLLGKLAGPVGFAWALYQGHLPLRFGWILLGNDLLWWLPFGAVLWGAYHAHHTSQKT